MSLEACKDCGHKVSTDAKSCPKCGKDNPTDAVAGWKLVGCGLLIIFALLAWGSRRDERARHGDNTRSAASEDARLRTIAAARVLRKAARNPDRFVVESALAMDDNDSACIEFRAENGFGGMNREAAVLVNSRDIFLRSEDPDFAAAWARYCAKKPGEDVTALAARLD